MVTRLKTNKKRTKRLPDLPDEAAMLDMSVAVDRAAGMPWDPAAIRHGQDFMMMRLGQKTVRYLDVRQEALARAARVGADAAANAQAGPRPSTVIRVRHLVPALPGRKVMGGDCPF